MYEDAKTNIVYSEKVYVMQLLLKIVTVKNCYC